MKQVLSIHKECSTPKGLATIGNKDNLQLFTPVVEVGLGAVQVSRSQGTLLAGGLASSVAVCVHDPTTRVAGIVHALLPRAACNPPQAQESPATFVDSGVLTLLAQLKEMGADENTLRAYLAGGADSLGAIPAFRMGERNVVAAREILAAKRIPVHGECVFGHIVRTLWLDIMSARVWVRKGPRGRC